MSKKKTEKVRVKFCPFCWKLRDLVMKENTGYCPECGLDLYRKKAGSGWHKKRMIFESLRKKNK